MGTVLGSVTRRQGGLLRQNDILYELFWLKMKSAYFRLIDLEAANLRTSLLN